MGIVFRVKKGALEKFFRIHRIKIAKLLRI